MLRIMTKFARLQPLILLLFLAVPVDSQISRPTVSQEVSDDDDNLPVLVRHLPDWEAKRADAKYFVESGEFRSFFKGRQISDTIDFFPGTEAVFATYVEGQLLIVEYSTPQASAAVDKAVKEKSGKSGDRFIYRRIGNYNVFLFDPTDEAAGNKLLGKIKYEKVVTWPWGNPKPYFERERAFITEASSLFINTVLFILAWLVTSLVFGALAGFVYFKTADRRRASWGAFSDAGGLTRLNLDGLTPNIIPEKLLDE